MLLTSLAHPAWSDLPSEGDACAAGEPPVVSDGILGVTLETDILAPRGGAPLVWAESLELRLATFNPLGEMVAVIPIQTDEPGQVRVTASNWYARYFICDDGRIKIHLVAYSYALWVDAPGCPRATFDSACLPSVIESCRPAE